MELKDIEQRLLTRKWGLSAQPRIARLRDEAQDHPRAKSRKVGARISDEVVTHLADNIRPTCAKSRGAARRWWPTRRSLSARSPCRWPSEVLKAYVQLYRKEISIERIIETVCDHLNIDFARLSSPERTREVAQARQIAAYLSKQHTKAPLTAIGASIGGRNHATVLHSCKAVTNLMETDRNFRRQVEEIENASWPGDGPIRR